MNQEDGGLVVVSISNSLRILQVNDDRVLAGTIKL